MLKILNIGPLDGGQGDTAPQFGAKINHMATELYSREGVNPETMELPPARPISSGGTGATTAEQARANLGLGSAATRDVMSGIFDYSTDKIMTVGAFGFGGTGGLNSLDPYREYSWADLLRTTMVSFGNVGIIQYGRGLSWSSGNKIHGVIGGYIGDNLYHANISDMSVPAESRQITYSLIRTSANTWMDGNGFLKAASPVGELYSNRFVPNDEAKLQDITFEKLGIGDYLLKGSTGLAQDGWYIEQPKDSNGNIFHAVEYGTRDNGDIWIKTYEQIMEGTRIVADHTRPVDIKEGRFISVRLNSLPEDTAAPQNPTIVDDEGNPAPSRLHELVDGVWVISDENAEILLQESRAAMAPLTRRQFRLALVMQNISLDLIENQIAAIPDAMQRQITTIEWQDATEFHRTSTTLNNMASLLNLSQNEVDILWKFALSL